MNISFCCSTKVIPKFVGNRSGPSNGKESKTEEML